MYCCYLRSIPPRNGICNLQSGMNLLHHEISTCFHFSRCDSFSGNLFLKAAKSSLPESGRLFRPALFFEREPYLDVCRPPRPPTRNRPLPIGCMSTSPAESCERRPRHGAIAASAQLHQGPPSRWKTCPTRHASRARSPHLGSSSRLQPWFVDSPLGIHHPLLC